MLSRTVIRGKSASMLIARRGFHSSPARLSGHYPEGPLSNVPFNPKTKYFGVRYWSTMTFFFSLPFMIAVWQTNKNQ